jgi:hypothetical protein
MSRPLDERPPGASIAGAHSGPFAGPMELRQRDRVAPIGLVALARPLRDQGRGDHQAIMSERPTLAIKPVSRRPGLEADMQPVVSLGRRLIVRSIGRGLFSTSPRNRTSPARPASAIATACYFSATSKATKDFAMLSHGPPCQWRRDFPQNGRRKIPQSGGLAISRGRDRLLRFLSAGRDASGSVEWDWRRHSA